MTEKKVRGEVGLEVGEHCGLGAASRIVRSYVSGPFQRWEMSRITVVF